MLWYYENSGVAFAEIVLFQQTIPASESGTVYRLAELICWGDVAAEYTIYVDNVVIAGGRTSESFRTLTLKFPQTDSVGSTVNAGIRVHIGHTIKITGRHCNSGLRTLKINVLTED